MAKPVVTFDKNAVVVGRQTILQFVIATVTTNLLVEIVDMDFQLEIGRVMAPGAGTGPAFVAKVWDKSRTEMLKAKTKEIKKLITLLGSLSGRKVGTCQIWVMDPDDAAGKVALKSDAFPCVIYRDNGGMSLSVADATEPTLVVESTKDGAVTLTADADE